MGYRMVTLARVTRNAGVSPRTVSSAPDGERCPPEGRRRPAERPATDPAGHPHAGVPASADSRTRTPEPRPGTPGPAVRNQADPPRGTEPALPSSPPTTVPAQERAPAPPPEARTRRPAPGRSSALMRPDPPPNRPSAMLRETEMQGTAALNRVGSHGAARTAAPGAPAGLLAPEERQLLLLLAEGLPLEAVARRLCTSSRTLRRRIRVLCDRIGVRTPLQAAVWAARRGLI